MDATSATTQRKSRRRVNWLTVLGVSGFVVVVMLPLLAYGFLRFTSWRSYSIPAGSMEPTLLRGDLVFGDPIPYETGDPQRGDVAFFRYPKEPSLMYVKRVIGLPGDVVTMEGGEVIVNGEALDEPYIKEPAYAGFGPETVPEGQYFVLGDNRNRSSDSRVWGCVPREYFLSKLKYVYFRRAKNQRSE